MRSRLSARLPPRRRVQLGEVTAHDGHVDGPSQLRVELEPQLDPGQALHLQGHVGDGDVAAAAHVVDLAGDAPLGQEPVGPHHVADVGEVAPGRQVPHHDAVGAAAAGLDDALASADTTKADGLSGTHVVEGAHA